MTSNRLMGDAAPAPRIAIIGCGAVVRQWHLPALRAAGMTAALLVDRQVARAESLAQTFGAGGVAEDYRARLDAFDAALVAVPNRAHAPICSDLLRQGKHVLVEKPMACSGRECEEMLGAAREGHAVLAVGLMRRFLHTAVWVKQALNGGVLGQLTEFDYREGFELSWPFESDYFMRRNQAGGGVLMDTGAHAMDLLLWWLGDSASFEYRDDDYGGVEADCEIRMTMVGGGRGTVELSRTRKLRNTCILRGTSGELEVGVYGGSLTARPATLLSRRRGGYRARTLPPQAGMEPYVLQIKDWMRAIANGTPPAVSGWKGARSVRFIEACYANRQPLEFPWIRPEAFLAGAAP